MSDPRVAPQGRPRRAPATQGASPTFPRPVHVLLVRDPREPSSKCSLTPLRGLPGLSFATWRTGCTIPAEGRILLDPEGEPLTAADAGRNLLLLDCSWRRLPTLRRGVSGGVLPRRLPALRTAYPRRSKTFPDPELGLASVEALFAALAILGAPRTELMRGYPWGEAFLAANPELASGFHAAERVAP